MNDILLTPDGDLAFNEDYDIILGDSVEQKINIRLRWFLSEWRWDKSEGLPYFDDLYIKNPDIDAFANSIRRKIYEIDEVTNVKYVTITYDTETRNATIAYCAITDRETIESEVDLQCLIME